MIPYLGIVICWLPAALIAAAQWGDWWHPFLVTLIFIAVQISRASFMPRASLVTPSAYIQ